MNATEIGWEAAQIATGFAGMQIVTILVCWVGIKYLPKDTTEEK